MEIKTNNTFSVNSLRITNDAFQSKCPLKKGFYVNNESTNTECRLVAGGESQIKIGYIKNSERYIYSLTGYLPVGYLTIYKRTASSCDDTWAKILYKVLEAPEGYTLEEMNKEVVSSAPEEDIDRVDLSLFIS